MWRRRRVQGGRRWWIGIRNRNISKVTWAPNGKNHTSVQQRACSAVRRSRNQTRTPHRSEAEGNTPRTRAQERAPARPLRQGAQNRTSNGREGEGESAWGLDGTENEDSGAGGEEGMTHCKSEGQMMGESRAQGKWG
ncbi:hypothetical protein BC628DRAFT_636070 [Trametes gibbosa]|nr:hypothetical protein BC628DRAFT_636070 [Trametes gibbosa]